MGKHNNRNLKTDKNGLHLSRRTVIILAVVFGVVLLPWLYLWYQQLHLAFTSAIQLEYSEGFMLWTSRQFAHGLWNWDSTHGPPFELPFYTPAFYYVYGWAMRIFGESLILGRVIVLTCALGIMGVVGLIVHHLSKSKGLAITAALLPLTQVAFVWWSGIVRVDMLGVLFELAGVFVFLRWKSTKWAWLSIPLFLMAFWTKQSFVAGLAGVCLSYLITERKKAIPYVVVAGASLLASIIVAQFVTGGQFIKEIFLFQMSTPKPADTIAYIFMYDYLAMGMMILGSIFFWVRNKSHPLIWVAIVAVAINLVSLIRNGGATNYQLEVIPVLSMTAVLGFITPQVIKVVPFALTRIGMVIFSLTLLFKMGGAGPVPDDGYAKASQDVRAIIADATYPIPTEQAGVVLDAGKVPYLVDPFALGQLSGFHLWDDSKFRQDLTDKRIEYVITTSVLPAPTAYRLTPEEQSIILDNYHVVYSKVNPDTVPDSYNFVVYARN